MQHTDIKKKVLQGLIIDMRGAEKEQLKSRKKSKAPAKDADEEDKEIAKGMKC